MSRPKPRGAAIGGRLSAVLQDDLADIASTMDWIDAGPPPSTEADQASANAVPEAALPVAVDPSLDLMLDDFALAVDAMFSVRDQVLAAGGATPSGQPGEGPDAAGAPTTDGQGAG